MPWASNADLPEAVRSALPTKAQSLFRAVANSALDNGDSEETAMRQAWGAVKQKFEKPASGGKWVEKMEKFQKLFEGDTAQKMHDAAVMMGAECCFEPTTADMEKVEERPLYVRRNLLNADAFVKWAKAQGFNKVVNPDDLHVTITYSRKAVNWLKMGEPEDDELIIPGGGPRIVEPLGDKGAVVLHFASSKLSARHHQMIAAGASHDYDSYNPHVTITYKNGDVDVSKVEPYTGRLVFGPEIFENMDDNWSQSVVEKFAKATVVNVDTELGIVFGWAIVNKVEGKEYFDLQGDHITEEAMLKAASNFMLSGRMVKEMHIGTNKGIIVFAWPLTTDIAKAMGISSKMTGLMIGMKPYSKKVLEKFKTGEYTGFSIGGNRIRQEDLSNV